jgi:hypothetical protein
MIRLKPRDEWMTFSIPTRTKVFPTRMQATWPSLLPTDSVGLKDFLSTSLSKLASRAMKPCDVLEALLKPSVWDMHLPWPAKFGEVPLREYPWVLSNTTVRTVLRATQTSTVPPPPEFLGHSHPSGIKPGTVVRALSARPANKSCWDLGILRRRMSSLVKHLARMRTSTAAPLSVPLVKS